MLMEGNADGGSRPQASAPRWCRTRCRWHLLPASFADGRTRSEAAVAQLVEQGTENPCVNSSILFGGILFEKPLSRNRATLQLRFQAYGPLR